MTPEEFKQLSKEEQRAAVIEVMGWSESLVADNQKKVKAFVKIFKKEGEKKPDSVKTLLKTIKKK